MATIIKRDTAHQAPAGEAVRSFAFDFEELSGHADQYVESVRQEAAKIVQQANTDAAEIRKKAEQAGRATAEQAIEKVLNDKVAKQMQSILPALNGVVGEIQQARSAWQAHWEQAVVGLATNIAGRIVRRELANQPKITVEWVREALELVAGASQVTVKLNANDHQHLGTQVEAVAAAIAKLGSVDVQADPEITPGGCRVVTEHGVIDGQVEAQLARMVEELS